VNRTVLRFFGFRFRGGCHAEVSFIE
jgi:hypothetical protein